MKPDTPFGDDTPVPRSRALAGERPANTARVVVLTCCDANAPCGDVFGLGGRSVMTIRTVGNTLGEDVLGSLEYACAIQGASVIVVLGHSHCEALAVACNKTEPGYLSGVLDRVGPAIRAVRDGGLTDLESGTFLDRVTLEHARRQAQAITTRSPMLAQLSASGRVSVIAAVVDSDTGVVRTAHPANATGRHFLVPMESELAH